MLDALPAPANALLDWYDRHARTLPWRALPGTAADPYAVWLSEIMLQQTGVRTVGPYYFSFLARWPNVAALAGADVGEVMKQWAGLGYYSRARSLHACARTVVAQHGCAFPASEEALLALPGIGPYTAAAIMAIAFGRRAVVVDGNVERVVTRLYAVEEALPKARPAIRAATGALTPTRRAGDFAQAMMDLGATICTPTRPACALCPLAGFCVAGQAGTMENYPRKAAKAARPDRKGLVFCLRRGDEMLLQRRAPRGLLGGMTEFPGSEWRAGLDEAAALAGSPLAAHCRRLEGEIRHVFTHFSLSLAVFAGQVPAATPAPGAAFWVRDDEIDGLALPTLMRKVWAKARAEA